MHIKITLNTSTKILYAGRNHRPLTTTVQLYARYSTAWLVIWFAIMPRYNSLYWLFQRARSSIYNYSCYYKKLERSSDWRSQITAIIFCTEFVFTFEPSKPKQRWHSKAQKYESLLLIRIFRRLMYCYVSNYYFVLISKLFIRSPFLLPKISTEYWNRRSR